MLKASCTLHVVCMAHMQKNMQHANTSSNMPNSLTQIKAPYILLIWLTQPNRAFVTPRHKAYEAIWVPVY